MRNMLSLMLLLSCAAFNVSAQKEESAQSQHNTIAKDQRDKHVVFVRPHAVLEQSEEFNDTKKQTQDDINKQASEIHAKAQRMSEEKQELQKEAQELQNGSKSKFTSEESRQQKMAQLQDREAELEKEENNLKYDYQRLREKHSREEQKLQEIMWDKMKKAAEIVGQEQGWGAIDIASMYVAPSLDITDDVAQAMNKEYRERTKSKKEAKQQTEQQAAQQTQEARSTA